MVKGERQGQLTISFCRSNYLEMQKSPGHVKVKDYPGGGEQESGDARTDAYGSGSSVSSPVGFIFLGATFKSHAAP